MRDAISHGIGSIRHISEEMKNKPKVSIVVLNYNNPNDTIECINSLMKNNYRNFDVILIDNGSTDNSVELLNSIKYKNLFFIQNEQNLGFAGGCNIGIRHALQNGAKYILLLNNDTVVKGDFLNSLIEQALKYPDAGAIGPKIYFYDEPDKIWFAGGYIDWKYDGAHTGYGKKDAEKYSTAKSVGFITGCAMLIKNEVIEKVGLLDTSFFAYQEDVDFCVRVRKARYTCIYLPYPAVWHRGGKTSKKHGRMSPFHRYLGTRNKLVLIKKNFRMLKLIDVFLREIFVVTPILIVLYVYRRHFDLIPAQIQGIIDAIIGRNKFSSVKS